MDDRPLRLCDVCGQLDDHPHHQRYIRDGGTVPTPEFLAALGDVPATAVAELMNPHTTDRHHDCCASQGCDVCAAVVAATKGATGAKLLKQIQSGVLDKLDV